MKSKYPTRLDTSVELPLVRDNVLEVAADALNSLRSAIINIEKTLGVNPQGTVGNTVASRLDAVIDGNGNILEAALASANLLSGPIINSNVSRVAGIEESKLKLNFPTNVLQSQLSVLNSEINSLITEVNDLSAVLSAHIHPNATRRHAASAISVASSIIVDSDTATVSIDSTDMQSVISDIYEKHINYTGEDISETNRSHASEQIYFDNSNVVSLTSANDAQTAIEDAISATINGQKQHQDMLHSNGVLKSASLYSSIDNDFGAILASDVECSFTKTIGTSSNLTTISFSVPIEIGDFNLKKSDIITISDASDVDELIIGSYEIAEINLSLDELTIESVVIFSHMKNDSTSQTKATLSQNKKTNFNSASLLTTVREDATLTSSQSVQISNPDSVKIVSLGVRPSEITTSNRFIKISIDEATEINLDLYSGSVIEQSIDSIISSINEQCAENHYNILAYKTEVNYRQELVIVHNIPDSTDEQHTLKVVRSTDDGIDAAGLEYIEDEIIIAAPGTGYLISGKENMGLLAKIDGTEFVYFSGSTVISNGLTDIDFLEEGVKIGDLLIVSGATDEADNGSYVIINVTASNLTLSSDQLPDGFADSSSETTRFRIFESIVSFETITFEEVASTFAAALIDVFMNYDQKLFGNKIAEYSAQVYNSESLIVLLDVNSENIAGKEYEVLVESGDDLALFSLNSGPSVEVRGTNNYIWLLSGTDNVWMKFFISDVDLINAKIASDAASLEMTIFGLEQVNLDSNMLLARVPYSSFSGRISGGIGVGRIEHKLPHGNISIKEISENAIYELQQQPISELRSNGVIYGLEVSNVSINADSLYTFDINRGVCYIAGKRYESSAVSNIITDINSTVVDKFFIVMNADGLIVFDPALPGCITPYSDSEVCNLAVVEFDEVNIVYSDLRLFIDELDYKLLNSITVSPQQGMAHFSSIPKALKYAKHFSHIFPDAGTPTIHLKSGIYSDTIEIDISDRTFANWVIDFVADPEGESVAFMNPIIENGIFIDFPVNIIGEGDSSVIKYRYTYIFSNVTYTGRGRVLIPGNDFASTTYTFNPFNSGKINISNVKFDNTYIDLVDLSITDGTDEFPFIINIENNTFNFDDFTATIIDPNPGPAIILNEISETTQNKGQVNVLKNTFIKSYISIDSAARLRNLTVAFNSVHGGSTYNLFNTNIFTFTTCLPEYQINIYGNINAENFSAPGAINQPRIAPGGVARWGDRLSRDLLVGGNLTIYGDVFANASISSETFSYGTTKTRVKTIFLEDLTSATMGSDGILSAEFSTSAALGRTWKTIQFADTTDEFARIRLDLQPGETLDELYIFYRSGAGSVFGRYDVIISSDSLDGTTTVELASTTTSSPSTTGDGTGLWFTGLEGLDIEAVEDNFYYFDISRSAATGDTEDIYYFWYSVQIDNIEAIGGLIS